MIVTAAVLIALAALAFGLAFATGSLLPLYGAVAASVAALLTVAVAVIQHGRQDRD